MDFLDLKNHQQLEEQWSQEAMILREDNNTVMVDQDPNIGTLWLTIAPNCDWVNARLTSKETIQTSEQSEERSQTGTESPCTVVKKTLVLSSMVHQDLLDTPCGRKSLQLSQENKPKSCLGKRNRETGSSTEDQLTTLWTRCSHCNRMHRYTYQDVLPNLVCQMKLKNGN